MRTIAALACLIWLSAALAWADELFDSTDVSSRLTVGRDGIRLGDIAPAAGHGGEEPSPDSPAPSPATHSGNHADPSSPEVLDGEDKAAVEEVLGIESSAAESGGHGSGEGDSKKKKNAQPATGKPRELPTVTIGGEVVITREAKLLEDISETTPVSLKKRGMDQLLAHRASIVPYAHNPTKGSINAPVQVVIFEDLACTKCMPDIASIDSTLAAYTSQTQVIHIHAPSGRFQDTNLPAFYAKVAARYGKFWEFREALVKGGKSDEDGLFDILMKTGIKERDIRVLMLTEARRYYREIDADVTLSRTFAVGRPPVVFINGIRLGNGGLPFEKMGDVLSYVTARIARGLPEPGP